MCGVGRHAKINIYWGGQFEKNKKYDYEQNPNQKIFKEKLVFKYRKLVFKYQNNKRTNVRFLVFKVQLNI